MDESKELQGFYKIFRAVVYVSVLLEFFEYAIDPAVFDQWGGILTDIHGRIKRWTIYQDGHPQGIVASMGMNNLYIETATELVSVYTLLNDAVAKGGEENMLTGAERSTTLWALNDRLSAFSRKLHLLYLSIRYYTFNDVWRNVTAGMLDRNNGEVARMAMSRWRRAASLTR